MSQVVIRCEKLSKRYRIGQRVRYLALRDLLAQALKAPVRLLQRSGSGSSNHRPEHIWALEDVCLEVQQGEVLGLIGRNGAGKTTLLKILARVTRPTTGYAEVRGRMGSLLEVGTGFHPELTGRENTFLSGAILGMSKRELARKFDELVSFAGVEPFIDTPLQHYSTGMQMRLAFAVAAHLEPEILLVDEVLAVGDVEFQKKCLGKMSEVARGGRTILFVSHQMNQIRRLCGRALWIDRGRIHAEGRATEIANRYEAYSIEYDESRLEQAPGPIGFSRWRIEGAQSTQLDLETSPEETVVKIRALVKQEVRKGIYFIALRGNDQTILWSTMYHDLRLDPGTVDFVHAFRKLPLNPGIYVWEVRVFDGDHWFREVLVPEMSVTSKNDSNVFDSLKGCLNLDATFHVEEQLACGVEKSGGFAGG